MKVIHMIFFYCLKYVELYLKLQAVVNLLLSFIYKPLNVLEGTFSGQISGFRCDLFFVQIFNA